MVSDTDISDDKIMRSYIDDMITQKSVSGINSDQRARLRQKLIELFDERMQQEMITALPDEKLVELEDKLDNELSDDDLEKFFDESGLDFGEVAKRALERFRDEYISGVLEVEVPAPRATNTGVDGRAQFEQMMMQDDEIVSVVPEQEVTDSAKSSPSMVQGKAGVDSATTHSSASTEAAQPSVNPAENNVSAANPVAAETTATNESAVTNETAANEAQPAEASESAAQNSGLTDLEQAIKDAEESVKGISTPLNGAVTIGGIPLPEPVAVPDDPEPKSTATQTTAPATQGNNVNTNSVEGVPAQTAPSPAQNPAATPQVSGMQPTVADAQPVVAGVQTATSPMATENAATQAPSLTPPPMQQVSNDVTPTNPNGGVN